MVEVYAGGDESTKSALTSGLAMAIEEAGN